MTWNEYPYRTENLVAEWVHEKTRERITIESAECEPLSEITNNPKDIEKCCCCRKDFAECTCVEVWVYDDKVGECDSVGVFTEKDGFNTVKQLIKQYPNGYFEKEPEPSDREVVNFT